MPSNRVSDESTSATNSSLFKVACPYLYAEWPFDSDGKDVLKHADTYLSLPVFVGAKVSNGVILDSSKNSLGNALVNLDISIHSTDVYANSQSPEWSMCGWIRTTPGIGDTTYNNISYPSVVCNPTSCYGPTSISSGGVTESCLPDRVTQDYGTYIVPIMSNSQYLCFLYKDQGTNGLSLAVYVPYYSECILKDSLGNIEGWSKYKCDPTLYYFVFPELPAIDFFRGDYWLFIELHSAGTAPKSGASQGFTVYMRADYMPVGKGHDASQTVFVPSSVITENIDQKCSNLYPPQKGFRWVYPYGSTTVNGVSNTPFVTLDNWSYYTRDISQIPYLTGYVGPGYLDTIGNSNLPSIGCQGPLIDKFEFYYRRRRIQTG